MAWVPELKIDLSSIPPSIREMINPMFASLVSVGVITGEDSVTIAAHCVLLEPKK
jgi:hypothetical protein